MNTFLKTLVLLFFLLNSSVGLSYATDEGSFQIENPGSDNSTLGWIQNNCDNMSPPLPVDEYMKCVENGGVLSFRDLQLQLKQHPVLARSNCWAGNNRQQFMNCLNAYVSGHELSQIQPQPTSPENDQPERLAEVLEASQ